MDCEMLVRKNAAGRQHRKEKKGKKKRGKQSVTAQLSENNWCVDKV